MVSRSADLSSYDLRITTEFWHWNLRTFKISVDNTGCMVVLVSKPGGPETILLCNSWARLNIFAILNLQLILGTLWSSILHFKFKIYYLQIHYILKYIKILI